MRLSSVLAAVVVHVFGVGAAVVFEDPFDTKDNWVQATAATLSEQLSGGKYIVENTSPVAAAIKHDGTWGNFTYSVKLSAVSQEHSFLGIFFCWNSYQCYLFTLTNNASSQRQYTLSKMVSSGGQSTIQTLRVGWNSFIDPVENTVKVSKSGSTMHFFCNGVWLDSLTDASYAQGAIGLIVGPGEKAAFDHALVTDTYETGSPRMYIRDSFDDGILDGWLPWEEAGTWEATGGAMRVSQGTHAKTTTLVTHGKYKNAPVKVIARRVSGDSDAYYGLIYMCFDVKLVGNSYFTDFDAFVFKISGDRSYAGYYYTTDSTKYTPQEPNSNIHGTVDTLEVTPAYRFVVNGDTLPNIDFDTMNFDFNAVGVIVDSNVTVDFDDFVAGDSAAASIRVLPGPGQHYTAAMRYELGGPGLIYDTRGRVVARYSGNLNDSLRNLGAGQFFIVPDGTKDFRAMRAIINLR